MRGYYAISEHCVYCNFDNIRYHYYPSPTWVSYIFNEQPSGFINIMKNWHLKVASVEALHLDDFKRQIENLFPEYEL